MNIFMDSHAHLNDPAFDADRAPLMQALRSTGVETVVEIGCQAPEWEPALQFARQYPQMVYAVLGLHPEEARSLTAENFAKLQDFLQDEKAVGIGEIGLDYSYLETSDKDTQTDVFTQILGLTKKIQKPIVLHVRRQDEDYSVYEDTFHLLKKEWTPSARTGHPGVLHCFSARYEEAKKALDLGLLLGINGCFTYKKNEYIREAVKRVGIDKIILETDCPYLSPQGKRGLRNDPANIPLIGQFMADYLDIPLQDAARITTRNAKALYGID